MQGGIEDLQGRFNLNLLIDAAASNTGESDSGPATSEAGSASDDIESAPTNVTAETRWSPSQKILIRLLQTLGDASLPLEEAMALTDAITDFMDADGQRRERGAEQSEYRYADFLLARKPCACQRERVACGSGYDGSGVSSTGASGDGLAESGATVNILTCPSCPARLECRRSAGSPWLRWKPSASMRCVGRRYLPVSRIFG